MWSAGIRTKYQRTIEDVNDLLDVQVEDMLLDEKLVEAIDLSRGNQPSRDKLIQWYQKATTKPNQTEVVGMCLHMHELKLWLGGAQFILLMEFIQYVVRMVMNIEFPQEFGAVKLVVDKALCHAWIDTSLCAT